MRVPGCAIMGLGLEIETLNLAQAERLREAGSAVLSIAKDRGLLKLGAVLGRGGGGQKNI